MTHDQYQELLHLSFHGELTDDERQLLEAHIRDCNACSREQGELSKLGILLDRERPFEITQSMLDDARRELRAALHLEATRLPLWQGLIDLFDSVLQSRVRVAAVAATLALVGFGAGYLAFSSSPTPGIPGLSTAAERVPVQSSASRITNFRFVQQPIMGDEVEFTFDVTTPVRMKGSVDDRNIQRAMAQALIGDQNPGVRLRTVNAVFSRMDQTEKPDREVKEALIKAAKKDPNVGVRKEAIRALQRFPFDDEIKTALLFALQHEENPGIRISVIAYLQSPDVSKDMVDNDLLDVLKERMHSDKNNFVRTRARNFYEEAREQ